MGAARLLIGGDGPAARTLGRDPVGAGHVLDRHAQFHVRAVWPGRIGAGIHANFDIQTQHAPVDVGVGLYVVQRVATMNRRQKVLRSEEHTSELKSLMRISYAVFCLKKKKLPINES